MKIMASGPITSWEIDGETVQTLFSWAPISLQIVTAAMKFKKMHRISTIYSISCKLLLYFIYRTNALQLPISELYVSNSLTSFKLL